MKKRSLVSAIAMLVVSAIVLSSATFAWFAISDEASVDLITADISNTNSTIEVRADNTKEWSSKVKKTDYSTLIETLNPVSAFANTTTKMVEDTEKTVMNSPSFVSVNYGNGQFDQFASNVADDNVLKYSFEVRYTNNDAENAASVVATPTFTAGDFTYGLVGVVYEGETTYYYFDQAGSYTPLFSLSGAVNDDNRNAIIDKVGAEDGSGDSLAEGATVKLIDDEFDLENYARIADVANKGTSGSAFTVIDEVKATKNGDEVEAAVATATVNVWVWAEGQDDQCCGTSASAKNQGFSFALKAQ